MTYLRVVHKLNRCTWQRIHNRRLEDQSVILPHTDRVDGFVLSRCNRAEPKQDGGEELHGVLERKSYLSLDFVDADCDRIDI